MKFLINAIAGFCLLGSGAMAASVNGTGLVTPGVIFGTGNANGAFTGENANGVEVGMRAKQRYPAANIFNYDGIDTYTFDTTVLTTNPANRSVFNFEWSVNVDSTTVGGRMLADYDHKLSFDTDAGAGVAFAAVDPFAVPGFFDHSLGNNSTLPGGGIESTSNANLAANALIYNVAQQSSNLGFGYSFDPDAPGSYAFKYEVFELGTANVLSSARINVNVLPLAPVPLPASLPLLFAALGGMGVLARRRRRS